MKMIAVDPGDRWTGVAFFETDGDGNWACTDAQEFEAFEFADALAETLIDGDLDVLVYERFRLYGDKAQQQTGSEFLTAQLIGIMRWLTRAQNAHHKNHLIAEERGLIITCEQPGGVCNDARRVVRGIEVVGQMADIKKPTRAILKAKKMRSVARPISKTQYAGREHVVDAELHGWYWVLHGQDKS